jgi:hypothetical protein
VDSEPRFKSTVVLKVIEDLLGRPSREGDVLTWLRREGDQLFVLSIHTSSQPTMRWADLIDIAAQLGYRTPEKIDSFITRIKREGGEWFD